MASTAVRDPAASEVSLARLYGLRATYLLLIVGLGATNLPGLISHDPTARGVIPSMLGGIWLLAFIGLRYPVQMLPLLLFELSWKTIWLFAFGLPQWSAGWMPPTWSGDFEAIVAGVILMPIVIPWGYVCRHYINGLSERWR
jgi:hypothetical protein